MTNNPQDTFDHRDLGKWSIEKALEVGATGETTKIKRAV